MLRELDIQRSASTDTIILHPTPTRNPNDPLNWKPWEKYTNFALVLLYCLLVFAFIDAATPTWAPMHAQLGFSYEILNDSYATGSAALSIGALIFIPFALKFGRRPIYVFSILVQFFISIWFAKLETVADLILVNAFSCLVGALAEVLVQMTVADVFFVHERGLMNSLYIWVQLVGAELAPLAAGYITTSQGWRWVWWWMVILFGMSLVLFFFLYEETKFDEDAPVIDSEMSPQASRKAGEDEKPKDIPDAENAEYSKALFATTSTSRIDPSLPRRPYLARLSLWSPSPGSLRFFAHHIYQPLIVNVAFPGCAYVALIYGLIFATWQVMINVVSTKMPEPPYEFDASAVGLMTLAPFIGTTIGSILAGPLSDRLAMRLAKRNSGVFEPEMRLWILLLFAPPTAAGTLLFGYSLGNGDPWIVVALGYAIFGFGMGPICSVSLTYLIDAYRNIVADALVGVTFVRNGLATVFVFAVTPWTDAVGLQNVFLTFGMIQLAILVPGTVGLLYFGKRIRAWTAAKYHHYSIRQVEPRGHN